MKEMIREHGKVTFGRLTKIRDHYAMQIARGEVFLSSEDYRPAMGFPTVNWVTIRLDGAPERFIENRVNCLLNFYLIN